MSKHLIAGIEEGEVPAIAGEELPLTLTTTKVGSNPTDPITVTAIDLTNGDQDVTSTLFSGSATAAGDVITLPVMKNLVAGHRYRVRVQYAIPGGAKPITQFIVRAEE